MNGWRREALAALVLVLFTAISHLFVTVMDADCVGEPAEAIELADYTDAEVQEALSSGELTAEMCLWMHNQEMAWQVDVERK